VSASRWEYWQSRFARTRRELEEAAAKGDERAIRILAEVDGKVQPTKVNAAVPVKPGEPHWAEREPGEGREEGT
jgi:N-acetylglucosamine kinase-like BadF-type ATPase